MRGGNTEVGSGRDGLRPPYTVCDSGDVALLPPTRGEEGTDRGLALEYRGLLISSRAVVLSLTDGLYDRTCDVRSCPPIRDPEALSWLEPLRGRVDGW